MKNSEKEVVRELIFESELFRVFIYEMYEGTFIVENKETGERYRADSYMNEMGVMISY